MKKFNFLKIRIYSGNVFRWILWKFGCDWLLFKKERFVEYPWILENINYKKQSKILDVGAGSTIFPIQLASLGHNVYALDLNDERNKEMKNLSHRLNNYHFLQANACKIPLKDKLFDYISFISSLEHISDDKKALKEARRVLKNDGRILITVPYGKKENKNKSDYKLYNQSLITKLLKTTQLSIEKKDFYKNIGDNWIRCDENIAEKMISGIIVKAIICLRLKKEI